ncbi:NADH-quinone oxidoreductase subunit C [Desulfovibrio sp. 86]|uniref:NADH dehydrogenase (Ubiquinone), 30 kDa subunit n=1 Tax=uncultured Desulfovibrio sp. TaxID=167968 RepID=A0A212KZV9_9BACT|nr:NADH-quinone oxidoreductase subunit C [Desulfovibrio sp. 86]SCM70812.1 NADH dehydrogenase (Ubiquinone), 30 kDa subunit [uncultured Desulfovibrio sp.]VZH32522.1 NADH dehydrogenase (Ubiquinone), 30 kDa subunit [Desulfovibrio sp. 86]
MNQQNTRPEALATSLAALPGAVVRTTEHAAKGYDLDVSLPPEALVPAVKSIDAAGYFLETITGVDWLGEQAALRKAAEAAEVAEAKKREEALAKQAEAAAAEASGGEAAPADATAQPAAQPAAPPVEQTVPADKAPLPEDDIEVVYDFNHFESRHRVVLRVRTPRSQPQVPTIQTIYPIAHWHEREAHDFFGIVFTGHNYLVPLLLPEDADFHPLLKDYGA